MPGTCGGALLVVGGGGGLGAHIAAALVRLGDPVVVADVDVDAAARVATALTAGGHAVRAVAVDVTDTASVEAVVADADASASGGLAGVVSTFGVAGRHPIAELTDERFAALVGVNLGGVVRVARSAVGVLRARGGGVIVNVASAAALRPSPGSSGYSASKGGVVAFSRSLAAELAPDRIRVWSVCPPAIETGMYGRMLADVEADPDARRIFDEARRPLGRVVQPEEVADLVAYLVEGRGPPYGAEPYVV